MSSSSLTIPLKSLILINNGNERSSDIITHLKAHINIIKTPQNTNKVFEIICAKETQLTPQLRQFFYDHQVDFALQDADRLPKKLFISDMDATMVVGETIDEIAEISGKKAEISQITAIAMQGKMDFETALNKRLEQLKGISKQQIIKLAQQINLTQNADTLMHNINQQQIFSCLISGGFSLFTEVVSQKLKFNQHVANHLEFDNHERLTGKVIGDIVGAQTKVNTLINLAKKEKLSLSQTIAIGDGANDALMIKKAGLGIAFYGKPALREVANAEIHSGTIDDIVYFF